MPIPHLTMLGSKAPRCAICVILVAPMPIRQRDERSSAWVGGLAQPSWDANPAHSAVASYDRRAARPGTPIHMSHTPPSAPGIDGLMLRRAGVITATVGIIGTVVGFAIDSVPGLIGGIFATVLVLAFFSIGQFALGSVLRTTRRWP